MAFSFENAWGKWAAWWESVWAWKNGFLKDSKAHAKGNGWLQTLTGEHSTCPSFAVADFWELKMVLLGDYFFVVVFDLFWVFFPISYRKCLEERDVSPRMTAVYLWEAGAGTKALLWWGPSLSGHLTSSASLCPMDVGQVFFASLSGAIIGELNLGVHIYGVLFSLESIWKTS